MRGDLTDPEVLGRASLDRARVVLVDGREDDESLTLTACAAHATTDNHLVVGVRDMSRARTFGYVDDDVRCVQWHSVRMIAEEIQDPGISRIYAELTGDEGRDTYSAAVPDELDGQSFGDLQTALGRHHSPSYSDSWRGTRCWSDPPGTTP